MIKLGREELNSRGPELGYVQLSGRDSQGLKWPWDQIPKCLWFQGDLRATATRRVFGIWCSRFGKKCMPHNAVVVGGKGQEVISHEKKMSVSVQRLLGCFE